jgi:regulator of sigma E protease
MQMILYILIAIFMFGALIFVHELGHFLTARLFHVTIYEFALGMGPKLISKKSAKSGTAYSLRLLPVGGFVSMAGEDEESDDEGALNKKPVWQRLIITAAGSFMNLLVGFLVMLILVSSAKNIGSTVVGDFRDGATSQQTENTEGLAVGDEILKINGKRVHVYYDMSYKIMRYGTAPIDITVLRNDEEVILNDIVFPTIEQQGILFGTTDFLVLRAEKNVGTILKTAFFQSVYTVRTVFDSLYDLISGKYGMEQLSGPIGITEVITNEAQTAVEQKDSSGLWSLFIILAINLGTMNLLPIPALDGGRIVFLIVEGIRRKPLDPKIEGYIHAAGMALLMLLMLIVAFKDIFTIIAR